MKTEQGFQLLVDTTEKAIPTDVRPKASGYNWGQVPKKNLEIGNIGEEQFKKVAFLLYKYNINGFHSLCDILCLDSDSVVFNMQSALVRDFINGYVPVNVLKSYIKKNSFNSNIQVRLVELATVNRQALLFLENYTKQHKLCDNAEIRFVGLCTINPSFWALLKIYVRIYGLREDMQIRLIEMSDENPVFLKFLKLQINKNGLSEGAKMRMSEIAITNRGIEKIQESGVKSYAERKSLIEAKRRKITFEKCR